MKGRRGPSWRLAIFTTAISARNRTRARMIKIAVVFGMRRRKEFIFVVEEDENSGLLVKRCGIIRTRVVDEAVKSIFFILNVCFGWITTKYESITSIPPT